MANATAEENEVFVVSSHTFRNYDFDDAIHFLIRYEMDLGISRTERAIYGVLDLIGDVGGFT